MKETVIKVGNLFEKITYDSIIDDEIFEIKTLKTCLKGCSFTSNNIVNGV